MLLDFIRVFIYLYLKKRSMIDQISHEYLEEENILIRYIGNLTYSQKIIELWDADLKAGIVHPGLKGVITVLQHPERDVGIEDLRQMIEYYKKNKHVFASFKMAQVINSPKIALPKLFESTHPEFKSKAFSTFEAAIKWIMQ